MKTTLQEITEKSGGFPYLSTRVMRNYIKDFKKGIEFTKHEMYGYYLAKEMLCWFAENCSCLEGDYYNAQRFFKKRDKAHTMRHLLEFNIY
jgi:hypothetical protein